MAAPVVALLPVSPRPLPGEALSSWVARLAARYDLGASAFLRQVLRDDGVDPDTEQARQQIRWLDALPWPAAEMALAQATRLDRMAIRAMRAARHRETGTGVWPRTGRLAWCQACVAAAAAEHGGEFHWRAEWVFGGFVVCPVHRRLLVQNCPVCGRPCGPRPVGGRLRLWCQACERCVTAEHGTVRSPLWPFSEPAATRRCCPTVVMDCRALKVLSRVQADLLRAAAGRRPTGPWGLAGRPDAFLASVRALACLALCALWEAPPGVLDPLRRLRSDWSPGDEPPAPVAGALGVVAAVLTSMVEWPWPGVTWNPELLRETEPADIDFDTFCWHLAAHESGALRHLLRRTLAAYGHAFDVALASVGERRAPNREEARRRMGFAGAARNRMEQEATHGRGTCADRAQRRRHAAARAEFAAMRRWDVLRQVRPPSAADVTAHDRAGTPHQPAVRRRRPAVGPKTLTTR